MIKTFTFALLHFSIAFTITYLLTGDMLIGGLVALVEPSVNTLAFYFHEKIWKQLEQRGSQDKMIDRSPALPF